VHKTKVLVDISRQEHLQIGEESPNNRRALTTKGKERDREAKRSQAAIGGSSSWLRASQTKMVVGARLGVEFVKRARQSLTLADSLRCLYGKAGKNKLPPEGGTIPTAHIQEKEKE